MIGPLDFCSEHGKGDFDLIYGIGRGLSLFALAYLFRRKLLETGYDD